MNVPDTTIACDHLEEVVPPLELLGRSYFVSTPRTPDGVTRHVVRLLAVSNDTVLIFDPPAIHPSVSLAARETLELDINKDFEVSSSQPFAVAQFMVGHGSGSRPNDGKGVGQGDPSQSVSVPKNRFLKDYTFATPQGYANITLNVAMCVRSEIAKLKYGAVNRNSNTMALAAAASREGP